MKRQTLSEVAASKYSFQMLESGSGMWSRGPQMDLAVLATIAPSCLQVAV